MKRPLLSALEGMPDPVLLADADGALLYLNPVATDWLGLSDPPQPLSLTEVLSQAALDPISLYDLNSTLDAGEVWTTRQRFRPTSGGLREARIRVSRVHGDDDDEPLMLAQINDLSVDLAELRATADLKVKNLLIDLLGSTANELGNSIGALNWAAGLADPDLASFPTALRQPMLEMRLAARRLGDLFQDLTKNLPAEATAEDQQSSPLLAEAINHEPSVRILVTAASAVMAGRLLDDLRRADLSCLVRTAQGRQQTVRAAMAGEVDAVVVGDEFNPQEFRALVKSLSQSAPGVAVFDPRGVDTEVLIRGIRGAVRDRRRRSSARQAWRNIEEIALRDPLTGVLNRRALDRFGRLEFARAQRYSFPLAVAFFDLDHFKQINDQLGHSEGDRTLQLFASALQAGVREMDVVARLGGDEFVVLMPHTDAGGALITLQRLRDSSEQLLRERLGDLRPRPGVSGGMAVFPDQKVASYEDLLARADQALYRAKRNRKARELEMGG
jgi:diguanylate cyclase (GGDEF)-like protein